MATWVRNGTGTAPSSTDADLTANYALDNATAPGDFDPDGVNSVRFQYDIIGASFTDDSWTDLHAVRLVESGIGTTAASIDQANDASLGNETSSTDGTDSSIPTGWLVSAWESCDVRVIAASAYATYTTEMMPDGGTLDMANLVVTIDYTPDTSNHYDETGRTVAITSTVNATDVLQHNFPEPVTVAIVGTVSITEVSDASEALTVAITSTATATDSHSGAAGGDMLPYIIQTKSFASDYLGTQDPSITLDQTPVEGNILLYVYLGGGNWNVATPPTGFTELYDDQGLDPPYYGQSAAYKVAGASDAGPHVYDMPADEGVAYLMELDAKYFDTADLSSLEWYQRDSSNENSTTWDPDDETLDDEAPALIIELAGVRTPVDTGDNAQVITHSGGDGVGHTKILDDVAVDTNDGANGTNGYTVALFASVHEGSTTFDPGTYTHQDAWNNTYQRSHGPLIRLPLRFFQLVQENSGATAGGDLTPAVSLGSAPTEDNLLVLAVVHGSGAVPVTAPSGYTKVPDEGTDYTGDDNFVGYYIKIAGASESTAQGEYTINAAAQTAWSLSEYSSADGWPAVGSIIDETKEVGDADLVQTKSSGVTATTSQALVLAIAAFRLTTLSDTASTSHGHTNGFIEVNTAFTSSSGDMEITVAFKHGWQTEAVEDVFTWGENASNTRSAVLTFKSDPGSNNYDETGRSVAITATVSATDEWATSDDVTVAITSSVTSTDAWATSDDVTVNVTSTATATDIHGIFYDETGLTVAVTSSVSATDQQDMVDDTTVAITSTATATDVHGIFYDETGRTVAITSVVSATDALAYALDALTVAITSTVDATDTHNTGGTNYDETGRVVTVTSTVTATDQQDMVDDATVAITSTATATDVHGVFYDETGLTVSVTSTVTSTDTQAMLEGISIEDFISDDTAAFKSHDTDVTDWETIGFDDSGWVTPDDLGTYGVSPWFNNVAAWGSGAEHVASWIWGGNGSDQSFYIRFISPVTGDMEITVDNRLEEVWINGTEVLGGVDTSWFDISTISVTAGDVVAIWGEDAGGGAGMIFEILDGVTAGGLPVDIIATVTATDELATAEAVTVAISSVVTATDAHAVAEDLTVSATSVVSSTDQQDMVDDVTVAIVATIDSTDIHDTPGAYDETGRIVNITAAVTVTDQQDMDEDTTVAITSSALSTDAHSTSDSLSVAITSTVAATSGHNQSDNLTIPVTSTVTASDRQDMVETQPPYLNHVVIVATVDITDVHTEANNYVEDVTVAIVASIASTDSLSGAENVNVAIVATVQSTDVHTTDGQQYVEDVTVPIVGSVTATDILAAGEALTVDIIATVDSTDSVHGVQEDVTVAITSTVTATDDWTMGEAVTVAITSSVSVTERADMLEALAVEINAIVTETDNQDMIDDLFVDIVSSVDSWDNWFMLVPGGAGLGTAESITALGQAGDDTVTGRVGASNGLGRAT